MNTHKIDKRVKFVADDPIYQIHEYDIDLRSNHIYLVGRESGFSVELDDLEDPGVEYGLANRFIRNINILARQSGDPILIHMKICFTRKTLVLTDKGQKKIKDIKIGDLVLTHTGKYRPVTNITSSMYDKDMVRIYYGRKKNNCTSLQATSEHPILVERSGVRSWIPISQIVPDDIIFIESSLCVKTGERIPYYKSVKNYNANRLRRIGSDEQSEKFEAPILAECERLQKDGWTVVPTDMRVRPDIVGFKNGRVAVFEVENMKGKSLEVKKEKYKNAHINDYIDEVIWINPNPNSKAHYSWYEVDKKSSFIKVKITGTKRWNNKYKQRVYNLTVDKDNSYVANHVVVHNCGGDWDEGIAMYDAIKACPNPVIILNYTHARSMSSLIFSAATKRVMMPHSKFMVHEGTIELAGTYKQAITGMAQEKIAANIMMNIYADILMREKKLHCKNKVKTRAWLKKEMDKKEDVFFTAQEAVDIGFADEIFGSDGTYDWKKLMETTEEQRSR